MNYKINDTFKTLIKSEKPYSVGDIFVGRDGKLKFKLEIKHVIKQEKNGKYWDNYIEVIVIKKVK